MYEHGLRRAGKARAKTAAARVRLRDGTVVAVPLERYVGPPDATDERLMRDVRGPVLDVGCGPGRHLRALAGLGVFALGVDLSPVAVELATGRGGRAIVASIFDELPGGGSWRTALLLDGNVGIGGTPSRLLARIGTLLRADGEVLVELDPPGVPTGSTLARIEMPGDVSSWFPWARVSISDVEQIAAPSGFRPRRVSCRDGRWFATLVKQGDGKA